MWPVASATAHRKLPTGSLPWVARKLTDAAVWLRDNHGTRVGICGMAWGGDLLWGQAVLDAGLDLWAYVPYPGQADAWTDEADRRRYDSLLGQAARVKQFGVEYDVRLLHERNRGMREDSQVILAVYDPGITHGGTYEAWCAARPVRPVIHLDPASRTVRGPLPLTEVRPRRRGVVR